jgi:hypothetical protein
MRPFPFGMRGVGTELHTSVPYVLLNIDLVLVILIYNIVLLSSFILFNFHSPVGPAIRYAVPSLRYATL